jgi:hypothetical protein
VTADSGQPVRLHGVPSGHQAAARRCPSRPHTSAFAVPITFLAVPVVACICAATFLGETLGALPLLAGVGVVAAVAAAVP